MEFPTLTLDEFRKAIKDVSQFELEAKKDQQRNFILRLVETNNELLDQLNTEISSDDKKLYTETINENKHHLIEQISRVESLNLELVARGLMRNEEKEKDERNLLDEINTLDKSKNSLTQAKVEEEEGVML